MSKYRPIQYLFDEYPVHQRKLNLPHPIYLGSGPRTTVLTMTGVTREDPEE